MSSARQDEQDRAERQKHSCDLLACGGENQQWLTEAVAADELDRRNANVNL